MSDVKFVVKRSGKLETLNINKINKSVERATNGLDNVSASEVVLDASLQLFNKIPTTDIEKALILSARTKIEKEPNYSYVAARLLLNLLYKEVFGVGVDDEIFEDQYCEAFKENIDVLVEEGMLDERLQDFDLDYLASKIDISRDLKFKYHGIQTLYDRYFLTLNKIRYETPQAFFMRVAMGLCLKEKNKEEAAVEIYNAISQFQYMPSTPTLFNSGTTHPQLSSCYLSTVDDSEDGIMGTLHDQARLSKYAGGLGVDWTPIRGARAKIKSGDGESSGVIPFLKLFNDVLVAWNQRGKRNGAGAAYMEVFHIDIEDFLELRRKTGDDRRRCHDMNTAIWISDLFVKKVRNDEEWYLFSPDETPELHHLYGQAFDKKYAFYVKKAKEGKLHNFKVVNAKTLWKKILKSLYETGHPWMCFKDAINICYSNKNVAPVLSSNLCVEVCRHAIATKYKMGYKKKLGETAVCNLASVNLIEHVVWDYAEDCYIINWDLLAKTVRTAIRGLDNVIDLNFYPIEEAKLSNMRHRPIGLGGMGFTDLLHALDISYESDMAVDLASEIQEFIAYHAIKTSIELAKERGKFESFEGSEWSNGNLPQDCFKKLIDYRGNKHKLYPNKISDADWQSLRYNVIAHGIRNSSLMCIAPTATISSIVGCGPSIDPDFSVLYVYGTMSGSFTVINEWFVNKAKKAGLWCEELLDALKRVDGDVSLLNLPDSFKKQFKTAFDIDYHYLVDAASARQQWIDMSQSFNIFSDVPSMKHVNDIYEYLFDKCLKTTYYFRSRSASKVEKSTVSETEKESLCSIEARIRGEECASCQ